MALAMVGGAGASGGVGSSYTNNRAECGGLVCFAMSPSALTAPGPRRKRLRGMGCAGRGVRRDRFGANFFHRFPDRAHSPSNYLATDPVRLPKDSTLFGRSAGGP